MKSYRKSRKVRVPEWDAEPVLLQELSIGDIAALMDKQSDKVEFAVEFVGRCLIGDNEEAVGAAWIRENVGASRLDGLMKLLEHAQDLNGFGVARKNKGKQEAGEEEEPPLAGAPAENEAGAGTRKNRRRARIHPHAS